MSKKSLSYKELEKRLKQAESEIEQLKSLHSEHAERELARTRNELEEKETPDNTIFALQSGAMKSTAPEYHGSKIRVLVADDHKIMREGLCGMLATIPDIEIVGEASNGLDAVEMALKLHPDIVIMDINMPLLNGIEATRRIKNSTPDVNVIGLSMIEEEDTANTMLKAGASAYLYKTGQSQELIESIRSHSHRINQNLHS